MSYIDKIEEYCAERRSSLSAFAHAAGIASGLISRWKSGEVKPSMKSLQKVADYMGISIEDLLRETPAEAARVNIIPDNWTHEPDVVRDAPVRYIPIFKYIGYETDEPDPACISTHLAVLPDTIEYAEECFGLIIDDTSMSPEMEPGDVVIVRRDPSPASGDIVICGEPKDPPVCRKLIRSNGYIILQPFNRHFEPAVYREEEKELLPVIFKGKVIATLRSINSSSGSVPEE